MLCDCLFLVPVLWDGDPGMGLNPLSPQEDALQLRYLSGISATTHGSRGSLFCVHPSYSSQYGFCCKSLVIRLLFSLSSVGYWAWLLYILVVILVLSWVEVSVVSTNSTTILSSYYFKKFVSFHHWNFCPGVCISTHHLVILVSWKSLNYNVIEYTLLKNTFYVVKIYAYI